MKKSDSSNIVQKLIQIFGDQRSLADQCEVSQQAISKWKKKGIPVNRVLHLEKLTNGAVTRYDLRPDLYPREEV